MDDSVKRYRERRDARIKERRARVDDQWITMRGTHVLIDDGGQVSKGPEKLRNVVKQGGGYKSKAERKYGSNDKFSKFMNNGWNTSNRNVPPTEAKSTKPARAHISEETKKALEEYEKTPRGAASKAEFQKWAERKKASKEKPGDYASERTSGTTKRDPKDFPMGRSKMRSSGKYTRKELRDEVKKLIDEKGGISKLTGEDFEAARKKLGASWEEWNNAYNYWYAGPGSKKL